MNTALKIAVVAAVTAAMFWLTASVKAGLTPFILAAVIAYVTAPLAEKMERRNMPPAAAAAVIVFFVTALILLFPFALLPLLLAQVRELSALLPPLVEKTQALFGDDLPALQELSFESVGLEGAKAIAGYLYNAIGGGVSAALGLLSIILITPIAAFYFMRDRKSIGGELAEILPPRFRNRAILIGGDLNGVLSEFLHGQLLVILIMAVFYTVALYAVGLNFALTIGVISGILVFIPYLGFILGLALATVVGIGQFDSWIDLIIIYVLMGVGTTLESIVITPRLVGERIGLHPLAVLFSLMAMGELFGFVGVLISLPTAAVLLVCLRHLRRYYISSAFYGRGN